VAEFRVSEGEKIDLYLGKGPYYRTRVDELPDDKTIIAPLPMYKGIPIILRQNQVIKMYFYRPNGRYIQSVKVIGIALEGSLRIVRLLELEPAEKQQRRDTFRVSTMLRAVVRPYELGAIPNKASSKEELITEEVPTFNISATGIAVRTTQEFNVGDRVHMRVYLTWPQRNPEPIDIVGEVRQIMSVEQELRVKQLGMMFLDISEETSSRIEKFVIVEQQRKVKQKKLVTDD